MAVNRDAIVGCILGTAVGDALGLPYEGVSPKRAVRLLGKPDRYRFVFRRGMISDDTEHTCMVAQSLIDSKCHVDRFTRRFAGRLRWWILALPAGVGKATAKSGVKLWLGASPEKSGVFSAGNGPAMRAAIFGAVFEDEVQMLEFVRASTRMTHRDPKAEYGAIAVALAAKHSRDHESVNANLWLDDVVATMGNDGDELIDLLRSAIKSVGEQQTTSEFAMSLGLQRGVTGYTYHTVPIVIHAWLSHPRDFRSAVMSMIECGGDADTTAAIVGGIVGTGVGASEIPDEWMKGLWEYPRSVRWMQELGCALAESMSSDVIKRAPTVNPIAVVIRNVMFLLVVLFHGFRRLAPPY